MFLMVAHVKPLCMRYPQGILLYISAHNINLHLTDLYSHGNYFLNEMNGAVHWTRPFARATPYTASEIWIIVFVHSHTHIYIYTCAFKLRLWSEYLTRSDPMQK